MQRIVIGAVIVISLIGTANAKADLPDCSRVSSPAQIENAKTARRDPAVVFAEQYAKSAIPASVACQSKLWQALHGTATAASSKRFGRVSAAGRRALSRVVGNGGKLPERGETLVQAYQAPQPDLRAVDPVQAPPLRDVHPIPPPNLADTGENHLRVEPVRPVPPAASGGPEGYRQSIEGPASSAPTDAGISFDGIGVGLGNFLPNSNPPDVNGHVGPTQYVQWNNTSLAVFGKGGALFYGPAAGSTLFQSLGGPCATHNDGDPVVNYDILASRWVLSQFVVEASPNASHQCIAVSMSSDALGGYYLYDFVTDPVNFVDYPHIGVWPDGYYMTAHVFNAAGTALVAARVYVFEREKMIAGKPARMQQKDLQKDGVEVQYGFLPADLDSTTPPPAGEASFVLGPNGQFTNQTDSARVAVTWGTTPTIALTESVISTVGIVSPPCVNNTSAQDFRDCVPQPAPAVGTDYLDDIEYHFMYRLAYRNFGGSPVQESIVASAPTAGSASTPGHGAIKWIEFRNAGNSTTTPTVFQSGTFDPDTAYRWLPSIAMDKDHNIALGYSKSSTAIKPGIYLTGRLGTDTLNTMGAEATVMAGAGSQTAGAGNRWGDYSAMTLDPIDQCTFWYTNEYLKTNGAFNWSTRIASYKFPSCTPSPAWGAVSGTVTSCSSGLPLSGVVVTLSNGSSGVSGFSGAYSIQVPPGTYTASAADADRNCTTGSPATVSVTVASSGTVTQNFCMSGTSNLQTNGVTINDASPGNNNGIINRNECIKLTVPLKNNGCGNETAISATLTTATPGVTVTQGSSSYANLAVDASGSNTTPFQFQTASTFACGTVINFTLTVNSASGSKALGITLPTCGGGANQTIPSGFLSSADPTQTDRISRNGIPSTCSGKASPGGGFTGTKYYKAFTFTNNSAVAACYTVNINAALNGNTDIESVAYSPSYNPASINTNYLGDSGISGLGLTTGSASYSFTVPALTAFVVVVNTTSTTTSSVFSGTVSGFADTTAGPGLCVACVPPATPAASNGGPYCAGSGTIALSTPTVAGATYAWTGPNGFTSSLQNPTRANATAADAGTYSVTVTVGGCTSAAGTTSVVVNQTPATPVLSNGGPYCPGATIALTAPSVVGATYTWSGPNGFTSSLQNPTRANATTADAGTYSVIVTSAGCPSAPGTTNVAVNPIPATPAASNGGPYCAGSGTIALSTPTVAGATYAWTGPNGFASSLQNPTRSNPSVADAGTYSVTVTAGGCTSAAGTTSVVINQTPATPVVSNGGPYCAGATIALSAPSVVGATYAWTGPNGFTSSLQNPTRANATIADAGTYSLTVTAAGCTSAAGTTSVAVNPIPAAPSASNGGPYCTGGTIALSTATVAGASYAWSGPNGFASSLQNPVRSNATSADAGIYSLTITVNGCTSPAGTTSVVVNTVPATPTASNGGPYCPGATITLSTPTVAGAAYAWSGPNGFSSAQQNPTRANATAADGGTYSVTITVNGCSSAAGTTNVIVNPAPATPAAANGGPYCIGDTIALSTPTVAGATYAWSGPNGFTSALQNPTRSSATAADAGTYSVTITVNSCPSAAGTTSVVVVSPSAVPAITTGGPTTFCAGGSVLLTSSSTGGNQWYRDGNPIAGATNQTYSATVSGGYTVIVSAPGCSSAASSITAVTVNPIPATPAITPAGPLAICAGSNVTLTSSSASGNQWYLNGNPIGGATNNTFSAAAAGNYTIVVTANGCPSAASAATAVTVNPIPTAPLVTAGGPTTFCAGGSVLLTSNSASGNQWLLNGSAIAGAVNQTYSATATGNYTVTVTTSGCPSGPSAAKSVTVNPIPAAPTITPGGPTSFCAGGSVTFTSSSASGNQWLLNGSAIAGAVNQTFTASAAGNYTVTVTTSGCTSVPSAARTVTVNPIPNAAITAPASAVAGSAGNTASVANAGAGATYNWIIGNGSITAGAGTNSITFTAGPAGTLTLNVTVATAASCSDAKAASVTILPAVTVTAIAPAIGTTSGGTPVTIDGTGFLSGAGVTFGGTAATNVVVVSAARITAKAPAHAAGSVNVVVTNANTSNGTLAAGYLYKAQVFDPNGDNTVDPSDIFFLVNYLFLTGPAPHGSAGVLSGDANADGLVDPSDVFYMVNALFLGGPAPHAMPGTTSAASVGSAAPRIAGSIALGKPVRRAGRYVVPVILTSRGSETPQAMSLRVRMESDAAIGDAAIRRAGAAKDIPVIFETSHRLGNEVSYLVAYDPRGLALGATRSAVVAEIEIESAEGGIVISIDPELTMLSDQAGMMKATSGNHRLDVRGTAIGSGASPRRVPGDQRN